MSGGSDKLKWWVLLTVIAGTFLGRLDQTIVNLAVPNIINDFGITITAAGWIATAYILANAVFVPIWGKLGDTIGRKKVYIFGFGIFILGSVLAGFAWNFSSLIVFRLIQAVASSADYPTAMAIIAITFKEGKERAEALGIWSSSFAAAAVFGPLVGGPLVDTFGWRSVFLVNLPVGIVGLLMALRFINESRSEEKTRSFDWPGALALGGSLSALILVLDRGLDWGWLSAASIACYAISIALAALFIAIEQRATEPIVDLKFFKIPAFVNTIANNFIIFMGMMGGLFLIPVFAQNFLGYNTTETGYLFMPMAAALMIAAPIGGRLTGKVSSKKVILASTFVAALGLYLFSFLDPRSTALDIIIPLLVMAFGMGFGMAQRTNIIASVVDKSEIGIASSALALVRNIAGAFGIALFGTALSNQTGAGILSINGFSNLNTRLPAAVTSFTSLVELKAQVDAYDYVFRLSGLIVFIGAFAVLWLKVKNENPAVKVVVE